MVVLLCHHINKFLSTLSLRRATAFSASSVCCPRYFYPRSPCGERLLLLHINLLSYFNFYPRSPCGERLYRFCAASVPENISIHALLAESDGLILRACASASSFLSTLSLRRATAFKKSCDWLRVISIHALLAESDALGRK